jgi:hypothetical protein
MKIQPPPAGTYHRLLHDAGVLDRGFRYREIVRGTRRKMLPPERHRENMIPTLDLANLLRDRMVERHRARGLLVRAAYRPKGGAPTSAHKRNAGIDLDLLHRDYHLAAVYYETAVELWVELGGSLDMGLGLYCRAGGTAGIRVHLDTHYPRGYPRNWQGSGRVFVNGDGRAALRICRRLGLSPPSRDAV